MEPKKISFGFKKIQRVSDSKLLVINQIPEERKDYIECVEENAIKVVGGEIAEEKAPLVIPMKQNTLTAERFKQIAAEVESVIEPSSEAKQDLKEELKTENETLEQQAARELLEEARNIKTNSEEQALTLPVMSQPLTGQKESTLDDYENVPITEYGKAMLRGMGWTAGQASKYVQPVLRPKGLGLGADKLVKQTKKGKKHNSESVEEELKLTKGCFVKILAGKHSSAYGKVVSLNEENARAIVELALGREQVTVGEQLLEPVTKAVYDERSKVINSEKYDEYKKKEMTNTKSSSSKKHEKYTDEKEKIHKQRKYSSSEEDTRQKGDRRKRSSSRERSRDTKYSDTRSNGTSSRGFRDEYNVKNSSRRDSRSPSIESRRTDRRDDLSKSESRRIHHSSTSSEDDKKQKHKQRDRSSDSLEDSSDEERRLKKSKKKKDSSGKRDIDKKRKGKKKKRDRDRSPHSRRHKK